MQSLALTRRGGGGGANEAHRWGMGGGGALVLTMHAPSLICTSYNEACSFSQTLPKESNDSTPVGSYLARDPLVFGVEVTKSHIH